MKTSTLEFPYSVRRVYVTCMKALRDCGAFRSIHGNERTFRISASKGLPIFGESLVVNVVATSSASCRVVMKSTDKLLFNPLKFGNNVRNVKDLEQFISNAVYRLCDPAQLGLNQSQIQVRKPNINIRH